jgi:hypothetical protein
MNVLAVWIPSPLLVIVLAVGVVLIRVVVPWLSDELREIRLDQKADAVAEVLRFVDATIAELESRHVTSPGERHRIREILRDAILDREGLS